MKLLFIMRPIAGQWRRKTIRKTEGKSENPKCRKNILTILLLAFIVFSVGWATAQPTVVQSGNCGASGNNLTFTLYSDSVLAIHGTGAMNDYFAWSGGEAPWYANRTKIKSITIGGNPGDSITTLGSFAFRGFTNLLVTPSLPTTVISLGNNVYASCTRITEFIVPNHITTLGLTPVDGCNALREVVLGTGLTQIRYNQFENLTQLRSVTIGRNIASISVLAFQGCTGLRVIKTHALMPPTFADNTVFADAAAGSLITVYVPCGRDSIYKARWGTYVNYGALNPYFPATNFINGMNSIKDSVYYRMPLTCSYTDENFTVPLVQNGTHRATISGSDGCDSIRYELHLTLPDNTFSEISGGITLNYRVVSCDDNTVAVVSGSASTGALIIPENVTNTNNGIVYSVVQIVDSAFMNRQYVSAVIPNSVISIGDLAFYNCLRLTTVTLGNSVETIGVWAFQLCRLLDSINLPNSLTRIKMAAFANTALKTVEIPNSMTIIENSLFVNCLQLRTVILPNTITNIEEAAFGFCGNLSNITLPNSLKNIDLQAFINCSSLLSIVIPNSVTSMGKGVFTGCIGLVSVFLSDSLTELQSTVFNNCWSLKSITIGSGITHIGSAAFAHDSTLMEVVIPDQVKVIAIGAFESCPQLNRVTLGRAVDTIKWDAFIYCPLMTIISKSLVPPVIYPNSTFASHSPFTEVHVVCRALADYVADTNWSSYFRPSDYRTITNDTLRYTRGLCVGGSYSDAYFTNLTAAGTHYNAICDTLYEVTLSLITLAKPDAPAISQLSISQGIPSLGIHLTGANSGDRYLLYRDDVFLDTVNTASYTDTTNISVGGYYCYNFRVLTVEGCLSDLSNKNCATVLSLAELKTGSLAIYPNPATTEILVKGTIGKTLTGNVQIIDVMGRIIIDAPALIFENGLSINVSTLPAGFYTVRMDGYTGKFIKE